MRRTFHFNSACDNNGEWVKKGIVANEYFRDGQFFAQNILQQDVVAVSSAGNDARFSTNTLAISP